ncbi:MAG: hypothetical protein H0T57_09325 [Rubrobacter sp.]|nr:hypothetical protein [Rubrobacter sp.]
MTNNRRRGDSTLLISFCNVKEEKPASGTSRWLDTLKGLAGFSSVREYKPVVATIDLLKERAEAEWIEIKDRTHLRGARGLCYWNGLICVAHQPGPRNTPPPGFVFLDPDQDFKLVGEGVLPSTPHSVCSRNGELYFTMTQEDTVYKATFDSSSREWDVSPYWSFPGSSGTADENHVNAIELVGSDLCVSATGKKEKGSDLWASAKRGFVYDIDRAEYLMHDIKQPHSLLEDSQTVWTCETRGSRILSHNGDEYRIPGDPTWRVRGLAINEDYFYVGVSKNRLGSKSKGTLRGYEGTCRIYRLAKGSEEPELLIDLSAVRDEIYELMLV